MGQGGKASLANTADADILEYILERLTARIEAMSRTFLVKVKTHRGEPLNEGADDQAEVGREMEKEGENFRWQERTTRVVYSYFDRSTCLVMLVTKRDRWESTSQRASNV